MRSGGNFNPEWGYLAPVPSFLRTVRVVLVATAIGATAGAAVVIALIDRPAGESSKTASVAAHAIVTSVQAAPAASAPPAVSVSVVAPVKVTTAESVSASRSPDVPQALPQALPPAVPQIAAQPPATITPPAPSIAPPQPNGVTAAQSVTTALPQTPAVNAAAPDNSTAGDASATAPKPAGMAALSEASPAREAALPETSDQSLLPSETIPPEKKTKHHVASAYPPNGKSKPAPGLGTVLRRIFSPHTGTSYYPNH